MDEPQSPAAPSSSSAPPSPEGENGGPARTALPSAPPLAKITDRFLAFLLDLLPFLAGYYGTLYCRIVLKHDPTLVTGGWKRIFLGWAAAYLLYQMLGNFFGATLGKRLLGLRVVRPDASRPGFARSVVRALGYAASMPVFNLGFIWALFQAESRAWHDLLARTIVIEVQAKTQGQAGRNALFAFASLAGFLALNWWFFIFSPTPADREAIRKAREGLKVLAAVEEAVKAERGAYADQLADLAKASGDVRQFKEAMEGIFDPDGFRLAADKDSFEIRARALDRRRSEVSLAGPLKGG
ncbi:MAG: RDD family protein [Elusimicrobia bacterium]|nr:RDD family protein [Elusimicrobiota bacterium]